MNCPHSAMKLPPINNRNEKKFLQHVDVASETANRGEGCSNFLRNALPATNFIIEFCRTFVGRVPRGILPCANPPSCSTPSQTKLVMGKHLIVPFLHICICANEERIVHLSSSSVCPSVHSHDCSLLFSLGGMVPWSTKNLQYPDIRLPLFTWSPFTVTIVFAAPMPTNSVPVLAVPFFDY